MNTKVPQHAVNTVRQAAVTSTPHPSGRGATAQAALRRRDEKAAAEAAERIAAPVNGQTPATSVDDAESGSQQSDDAVTMDSEAVDQSVAEPVIESPSTGAPSAGAGFAAASDSAAMTEGTRGASSMAGSMAASGAASPSLSPLVWIGAPLGVVGAIAAAGGGSSSGGSSSGKPPAGTNPDASGTPGGQPRDPAQAGDPAQTGNPSQPGNSSQPGNPSQPANPSSPGESHAAPDQPPPRLMASPSNGDRPLGIQGQIELDVRPDCTWLYSLDGGASWRLGAGNALPSSLIGEGTHDVQLVQLDGQGRRSEPVSVTVEVDLQAPSIPTLQLSTTPTFPTQGLLTPYKPLAVAGVEPDAHWEFSVDGGLHWLEGHGSFVPTAAVPEGPFTVLAVQIDEAGNRSATARFDGIKDTVGGQAIVSIEGGVTVDGQTVINADGFISVSGVEDGGRWLYGFVTSGSPPQYRFGHGLGLDANALGEGVNVLAISAIDAEGNGGGEQLFTIVKDTTAAKPALSLSGVGDPEARLPTLTQDSAIRISGLEPGATWEYSVDDGEWKKGTGDTLTPNELDYGLEKVRVVQIDAVNNRSEASEITVNNSVVAPLLYANTGAQGSAGLLSPRLFASDDADIDGGAMNMGGLASTQENQAALTLDTQALDPVLLTTGGNGDAVL